MRTEVGGRRRWRLLSIVAAANLAAVGLVAAPSQAQGVSLCSGTAEGFTIAGDLAVPAGASCTLIDSTVRGNVVVRDDANLSLEGATIRGNLTVRTNGFVATLDSSVGGVTALREAFGAAVELSELRGGVNALNSGFFFSDGTTHGVRVVSDTSQTVILSGVVSGEVRTTLDLLTDLRDSVVTGGLTVDQAELGSVICESEIDGNAAVRGSGDLVQIGDSAPVAGCAFNVFGGSLTLADNTAEIRVSDNVIRGNLDCTGNATSPTGSNNRIRGEATGQCADLAPAAVAPAFGGLAEMTTDSRIARITGQIEDRSAAATAEAVEAGPADL
jgi:hypothetical protein